MFLFKEPVCHFCFLFLVYLPLCYLYINKLKIDVLSLLLSQRLFINDILTCINNSHHESLWTHQKLDQNEDHTANLNESQNSLDYGAFQSFLSGKKVLRDGGKKRLWKIVYPSGSNEHEINLITSVSVCLTILWVWCWKGSKTENIYWLRQSFDHCIPSNKFILLRRPPTNCSTRTEC